MVDSPAPARVRLDVWLDVACLCRTRSEAQKACQAGRVLVGGQRAKPHRDVKVGDAISLERPGGRRQEVVVKALADHHVAKALARELYDDVTPPPTPEEVALRQMLALARPLRPPSAPTSRDRKTLRRLKEEWE